MKSKPKISVITPSYNQGDFLDRTIQSILSQKGDFELEYYIIDGGSKDQTIDILDSYKDKIKWISEPDNGQADAVNKGIELCSGDIIGWLNSDDLFTRGALHKVAEVFQRNPDCMWLYGQCKIIDENDNEIRKWITKYKNINLSRFSYKKLLVENFISQPAVFLRRELIEELGKLNTTYHLALDYDLWLRFAKQYQPFVIRDYLASFRKHTQSKSESDYYKHFAEEYRIAKKFTRSPLILFLHWLNIWKIVASYSIINFLNRK